MQSSIPELAQTPKMSRVPKGELCRCKPSQFCLFQACYHDHHRRGRSTGSSPPAIRDWP